MKEQVFFCGKNRSLQIGQKERTQHRSQHVLLMLISTLTVYANFEKQAFFCSMEYYHDVL
jgi:hypothetical protein